ncbi:MAG: hypothetical protein R3F65_26135 [bacterium]
MSARSFPVVEVDLTPPLDAAAAASLAEALRAGALVDAAVCDPAGCAAVIAEITALQAARFDPRARHFTEILWTETEASLGRGTEQAHGTERLDRAALPVLAAVAARVDAMCRPLRAPGERLLLSITPSIDKDRSFPRFYHQDSPTRPHCYRLVWDLGLARPGEILDVHFMPRARVEDAAGRIRPAYAHLFQQVAFDDHYALDDAAIDARQPQVREETLPTPADRWPSCAAATRCAGSTRSSTTRPTCAPAAPSPSSAPTAARSSSSARSSGTPRSTCPRRTRSRG